MEGGFTAYIQAVFSEALCWDRLFGGGAVFMLVDDGQDTIEPLDLNRARRIERLEVLFKNVKD